MPYLTVTVYGDTSTTGRSWKRRSNWICWPRACRSDGLSASSTGTPSSFNSTFGLNGNAASLSLAVPLR